MTTIRQPLPVIDLSECGLCDICVETCPDIFIKNDAGYIEVSEETKSRLYDQEGMVIDESLLEEIKDAIKTCRGDCISWDETP